MNDKISTVDSRPGSFRASRRTHKNSGKAREDRAGRAALIYDRLIELCLAFLVIFTPLAHGAVQQPYVAVFEITASFMFLFWALRTLSSNKVEWASSPLTIFFPLFILYVSAQVAFYKNSQALVFGPQQLLGTIYPWVTKRELLKVISYAIIFFVTLNTLKTRAQIMRILSVVVLMGSIMSVFFLMRYFGAKAPRGFINPDHFSAYLGMIVSVTLGLFIASSVKHGPEESGSEMRFFLLFCVVIMGTALFFTMSRGGIFSLIGALLFMMFLSVKRKSIKQSKWTLPLVIILVVMAVAWLGATPVVERLMSIKVEITSKYFSGRLPIWEGAIGIIKDHPLFGTGLGTFNYVYPKYQPVLNIAKHYAYAHSDILELLLETGVIVFLVTLISGLWTAFWLFRRFIARHDPWVVGMSIGSFGALTGIFLHSFTDFNLKIQANAILLTVIFALTIASLRSSRSGERGERAGEPDTSVIHIPRSSKFALYPVAIVLATVFIVVAAKPAIADHCAAQGGIIDLKKAIVLDPDNALYHYQLGKLYAKQGPDKQAPVAYLKSVISEYEKAVELDPANSGYHQSLAWGYGGLFVKNTKIVPGSAGDAELVYKSFETASMLEPNNSYRYRAYAIWLFDHPTEENIEKGVEQYKKASVLAPKLEEEALKRYFTIEQRYKELKKILPDTPENHYKVMNMLLEAGLWEINEADFKEDMERARYKYPYYKAIARRYESMGNNGKSLEILKGYITIDRDCADAHFWIADILMRVTPTNWEDIFYYYNKSVELDPGNTFYREWYARRLFLIKRYDEAIAELETVLKIDWWNAELYRLLGDWYKAVGRIKDAEDMYKKASVEGSSQNGETSKVTNIQGERR